MENQLDEPGCPLPPTGHCPFLPLLSPGFLVSSLPAVYLASLQGALAIDGDQLAKCYAVLSLACF